jgi:hypothetical protein
LIFVFNSCDKNNSEISSNTQNFEMSENGQLVYNKLVAFKKELNNTQKSSTTLSIDSAQWYIEAYYNVTQGYPDSLFGYFRMDTAYYSLAVGENELVNISDIATIIGNMSDHLNTILSQNSGSTHMVVGDVVINPANRSTETQLIVYTGIGIGNGPMYTPFVNEWWYWGYTLCRCDPVNPPPPPPYHDAGDELELRFNSPNPWYVPAPACVNGKIKIIAVNQHSYITGEDNPLIYGAFVPGIYNPPCLDSGLLNTLLSNGAILIYNNAANGGVLPSNGIFTSVDITTHYKSFNEGQVNGFFYYHGYDLVYSTYECLPNGSLN